MGNENPHPAPRDEETILFLFLTFGILIVLMLIFLLLFLQTYLLWRVSHLVPDPEDPEAAEMERGYRRWDRERKERKKALRALEKRRVVRGSWGFGSGSRPVTGGEMGMSGARGSSVMLDKFVEKEGKKSFWNIKRWI
jgi:hypothetical protein